MRPRILDWTVQPTSLNTRSHLIAGHVAGSRLPTATTSAQNPDAQEDDEQRGCSAGSVRGVGSGGVHWLEDIAWDSPRDCLKYHRRARDWRAGTPACQRAKRWQAGALALQIHSNAAFLDSLRAVTMQLLGNDGPLAGAATHRRHD